MTDEDTNEDDVLDIPGVVHAVGNPDEVVVWRSPFIRTSEILPLALFLHCHNLVLVDQTTCEDVTMDGGIAWVGRYLPAAVRRDEGLEQGLLAKMVNKVDAQTPEDRSLSWEDSSVR